MNQEFTEVAFESALYLYPVWSADTIEYEIKYYVQGLDGNYGDAAGTIKRTGKMGDQITIDPETDADVLALKAQMVGFTLSGGSRLSGNLTTSFAQLPYLYFKRGEYTITYLWDGKTVDGAWVGKSNHLTYDYGEDIRAVGIAARDGYARIDWYTDEACTEPFSLTVNLLRLPTFPAIT